MKNHRFARAVGLALPVFVLSVVASMAGPLQGVNGHHASGSAVIAGGKVTLSDDFKFDGAPDIYVTLRNGERLILLGKLRANSGAQSYSLPAGDDAAGAEEILLYCKQYNVVLGKAPAS